MPIRSIDPHDVRILRTEAQRALDQLGQKFDLAVNIGSARYSTNEVTFQLKMTVKNPQTGIVETSERLAYKEFANTFGLNPSWLDQEFVLGHETYRVTGLNTRSTKYRVQGERVRDGRRFKFPVSSVVQGMKNKTNPK